MRGKPVLVVADSRRRSVIMTASYEARAFGVKTAMNLYEARKLCPHAIVVDGNSEKYMYFTTRILDVLETFSDQVEMFSCDEAFLDITASLRCFGTDGAGIAQMVKAKIKSVTGLPCSIGVAPNKLLAKLASERQKPDGLTVIPPDFEREDKYRRERKLSPYEFDCLLNICLKVSKKLVAIVIAAAHTGLRYGSLMGILKKHVNLIVLPRFTCGSVQVVLT